MSSYIPGHEHYPGHNNWKRDMLYGCGDGSGYDRKPNPLDDGFHISNRTNIYVYGGNSNGGCHGSRGFLSGLLGGLTGANSCWSNESSLWGRLTGSLLSFGANLGLASLMNKWSGGSIYGTGLGGGGYQFIPTSWTGGGSSIFGSGFGGGYAGTGDMLINSTGMLPWSPVPYSGVGNSGNGTGGTNGTGGANNNGGTNTDNNSQGATPQNNVSNNHTPSSNANNDGSGNGNGNGSVISANEFNNAIDDLASDGKTTKLYYGIAQNTNESMKGYLEKTESKHGEGVDAETQKRGIRAGKANEAAGKETKDKQDGYYKYITLTDGTSNNEYTYTFVSAKGDKLTYKLSKDYTDTSKDDNGDDKGWEGTGAEPEVVIRIKDGVIYLESSGTDYSATKKSAKQA